MNPIKNYTTTIDHERTVSEIEAILRKHGISRCSKEYDKDGVSSLTFTLARGENHIPFRLPIDVAGVKKVLDKNWADSKKSHVAERKGCPDHTAQARRVGWRILKDWVDAQLALQQIGMVSMEQVFMPYLFDINTGVTLFQKVQKVGFTKILQLAP